MRYSSAVVLTTIVVGQAAAANLHNRHASFHARRQGDVKRNPDANVDWNKVAYDLSDVNWDSVFASSTATATAAAPKPTTTQVQQAQPTVEATHQDASTTSKVAAAASSAQPAETSSASDPIGDLVSDIMHGVEAVASKLGCQVGLNQKSSNGGIWIGSDSKWKAQVINDKNEDAVFYCWKKGGGYSGMIVKDNVPDISVGIKSGESVTLSFADQVPFACAPVFSDTKLAMFGGISNTWFEGNYGGQYGGTFDISRNVNMHGNNISSKGSKCTSDMNNCVFRCVADVDSCETGYELSPDCVAATGGGGGFDPAMGGTGGGCSMSTEGETIKVVLS